MPFTLLPHTADLRASIVGADLHELYQSGVDLVRDTLIGSSSVEPRAARQITLDASDAAEHFFRFLRELVYLYDVEGFLPAVVDTTDPLVVAGEPFDPERHGSQHQVKAVTRHGYTFDERDGTYAVEVIFDL